MESKITSTSSATDDSTSNNSKNLIVRFVEYSFQILNHDMDEFFEDNMMVFDQDQHDLEDGRGETLEQYDVYQKYLKLLEVYFDEFAMKEGYQTSKECFDDINQLIVDDEIERKKLFKEMTERMMEAFHQLQQQINDANENIEEGDEKDNPRSEIRHGSKVHDEDEDEKHDMKLMKQSDSKSSTRVNHDKKDSKNSHHDEIADAKTSNDDEQHQGQHQAPAPPVIMFFQPVSLDSMLQHVLSLTEYTTFSYIIRTKLKQKQLYLSLLDRVEKQSKNTTKRLKNIERKEHLEEIYQELIQRICDFAPNQPQFQTQIRSHLSVKSWNELLSAGTMMCLSS